MIVRRPAQTDSINSMRPCHEPSCRLTTDLSDHLVAQQQTDHTCRTIWSPAARFVAGQQNAPTCLTDVSGSGRPYGPLQPLLLSEGWGKHLGDWRAGKAGAEIKLHIEEIII